MPLSYLLYLWTLLLWIGVADAQGIMSRSEGKVKEGFGPPVNSTIVFAESLIECQILCMENPNCMSFFINNITKQCAVMDIGFVDNKTLPGEAGWVYATTTNLDCPKGFFYNNAFRMCYKLHNQQIYDYNYTSFKEICYSEGGDILIIENQAMSDHFKAFLESQHDTIYNYAIQCHWNGTHWVYDDGTEVTFFEWAVKYNKPANDFTLYGQGFIVAHPLYEYKWTNKKAINPGRFAGFICSMKLK